MLLFKEKCQVNKKVAIKVFMSAVLNFNSLIGMDFCFIKLWDYILIIILF